MSENSSKNNNIKDTILALDKLLTPNEIHRKQARWGLGVAFGIAFLISVVFAWGPYLWILAFIVTFGSLIAGTFLLIRSFSSGDKERQAVNEEIEAMANDASFDVSEQIIVWDKIMFTKGLGTPLEGREREVSEIHRRLVNVRGEIAAAETPQHRLEAVLTADMVLATARSLR